MTDPETPQQRRLRYLLNAQKAREAAARSSDREISARYVTLAETWERLARDIVESQA